MRRGLLDTDTSQFAEFTEDDFEIGVGMVE